MHKCSYCGIGVEFLANFLLFCLSGPVFGFFARAAGALMLAARAIRRLRTLPKFYSANLTSNWLVFLSKPR